MDFTRGISHFTADQSTTTTSRRSNNNLTAGHKNLPEIYLLVLVSCLYTFFIRVGGNFINVSGIVAYFLLFIVGWDFLTSGAHILLSISTDTFLYFHISVTVSIVILFSRENYNNCLLLNNLTRSLESDDVDVKEIQWIVRQCFELNSICLIAVRWNMRAKDSWGSFRPGQTFLGLYYEQTTFDIQNALVWLPLGQILPFWRGFISTRAVKVIIQARFE